MNHYTYLIQHKTEDKRYIGCRSCTCEPNQDLKYWGSSKHLPKDIQSTHVKIILKAWSTRAEAIAHEVLLHELNNVAEDTRYYNKAKQTSTGFDTSGLKLTFTEAHIQNMKKASQSRKTRPSGWKQSEEVKTRIRNAKLGKPRDDSTKELLSNKMKILYKNGYVNPKTGTKHSEETRRKISQERIDNQRGTGANGARFSPWFIQYPDGTIEEFFNITKTEKSIIDNLPHHTYQDLASLLKGVRKAKRGRFKDYIVGNIPVNDIV